MKPCPEPFQVMSQVTSSMGRGGGGAESLVHPGGTQGECLACCSPE